MHYNQRNSCWKNKLRKQFCLEHTFFTVEKWSGNFLLSEAFYLLRDVHFSAVFSSREKAEGFREARMG